MTVDYRLPYWGYWLGRLLLGLVFIYAAALKMASPQEFADSIAAYQILPFTVINLAALALPLFELSCGLLVLTGFFLRVGLLGLLGLLVVFAAATIAALLRGLSVDCGCFGPHSWFDTAPWVVLLRDGILLAITAFLYVYVQGRKSSSTSGKQQ